MVFSLRSSVSSSAALLVGVFLGDQAFVEGVHFTTYRSLLHVAKEQQPGGSGAPGSAAGSAAGSGSAPDTTTDPCLGLQSVRSPTGALYCLPKGMKLPPAEAAPEGDIPAFEVMISMEGLVYEQFMSPAHEAAREELSVLLRKATSEIVKPMLAHAKKLPKGDVDGSDSHEAGYLMDYHGKAPKPDLVPMDRPPSKPPVEEIPTAEGAGDAPEDAAAAKEESEEATEKTEEAAKKEEEPAEQAEEEAGPAEEEEEAGPAEEKGEKKEEEKPEAKKEGAFLQITKLGKKGRQPFIDPFRSDSDAARLAKVEAVSANKKTEKKTTATESEKGSSSVVEKALEKVVTEQGEDTTDEDTEEGEDTADESGTSDDEDDDQPELAAAATALMKQKQEPKEKAAAKEKAAPKEKAAAKDEAAAKKEEAAEEAEDTAEDEEPAAAGSTEEAGSSGAVVGSNDNVVSDAEAEAAAEAAAETLKDELAGDLRVFVEWTSVPGYPPVAGAAIKVVGKAISSDSVEQLEREYEENKNFYVKNWQGHLSHILQQTHMIDWGSTPEVKIMGESVDYHFRNFVGDCRIKLNNYLNDWEKRMPFIQIETFLKNSCSEFPSVLTFDNLVGHSDSHIGSKQDIQRCKRFSEFLVNDVLSEKDAETKADKLSTGCRRLCKRKFGTADARCQDPKPFDVPGSGSAADAAEDQAEAADAAAEDEAALKKEENLENDSLDKMQADVAASAAQTGSEAAGEEAAAGSEAEGGAE